jgi:hypothetical protein
MAFLGMRKMTIQLILVALMVATLDAHAEGPSMDEYQVKAAFLFNFAKFVEWPSQAFKSADEPIAMCVLGKNPFGSSLEEAVRGKAAANRTFVVRQVADAQQASTCHILFVGSSERKRSRSLLGELKASSILTVGETESFTADGGVITFKLEGGRIRIEIDPDAAERAKLHISSKLLSLAQIAKK